MKLFKREGYDITISDEAMSLKAFRDIWKRDRSINKERATMELSFCYFMEDPRSDYQYMTNKEDRQQAVILGLGLDKGWKPDKLVEAALEFYASFQTTSSLLLEDTRIAVDKLRQQLRDIDLEAEDRNGKPIYTLNTVVSTIKQVPGLVEDLDKAERAIHAEIALADKVRGAQDKSMYEDL